MMFEKRRDHESARYSEPEQEAGHTAKDHADDGDELLKPGDTLCGIGCFKPACMQPLAHMFMFIPTLSLSIISSFAYGIYIMSQVTTLEKQFGITSTESGILLGANDVGFLLTILLWSHFSNKMHKPRVLAVATLLFALSALISVIPHFLMISQASDMYESSGTSSASASDSRSLCLARNVTGIKDPSEISENSARIRRIGYSLMFVSFGLQGIARSPRAPVTATYIDDNVPKTQTGIYMGVMVGLAILGPVFGSSIGGVFSQIYVTLEETSLGPRDPRFIGAWWLGFLLFASIALVAAVPLLLFPKRMPNAPTKQAPHPSMEHTEHIDKHFKVEKLGHEAMKGMTGDYDISLPARKGIMARLTTLAKPFFSSLLRIVKNPLYMLIVGCDSIMFLTIAGRITFYPKYLQQYFRIPTSRSNFLFGVTIMLPLAFGGAIGGFLTHRLKLTIRGCMILRWLTDGIGAVTLLMALLVTCEQPTIYGLSNPTELLKLVSPDVTNMTCDISCMCEDQDFLPSCGADNRTYFSPCHAGCTNALPNRHFANCACVPDSTSFNQTVAPGYCEGPCSSIVFYFILSAIGAFLGGLNSVPTNLTQLRSVDDRDRSMSVGISGLMRSAIGFFAGPIIFGKVVDTTCLLWSKKGSCSLYDGDDLRVKLHVFSGGVLAAIIIVNGIIVFLTYKMERYCKVYEWQRQGFQKEIADAKKRGGKGQRDLNGDMHEYAVKNNDIPVWMVDEQKDKEVTTL